MNLARIHDKYKLRSFWEQRIQQHSELIGDEENRMRSSSLAKLREEWLKRLILRDQHQESFYEERVRRAQKARQALSSLFSS